TLAANNNNYSGTTTVSAGGLSVSQPGALPGYASPGKVSVNSGATLYFSVGNGSDWQPSDLATALSNANFASGATLGLDTSDGNFTYGSAISGNLGLTKIGGNTLTLTAASSYSGLT